MKKKLINIFGNEEYIKSFKKAINKKEITPPNINLDFDISINDINFDISLNKIIKKEKPIIKIFKSNGRRKKRSNRLF
jgi:hypothetical protein